MHKSCSCYWPERSREAAEINDLAYRLFDDLVSNSALSCLLDDGKERKSLGCEELNKHGLLVSFIGCRFRFSDYYALCQAIEPMLNIGLRKGDGGNPRQIGHNRRDTVSQISFSVHNLLCKVILIIRGQGNSVYEVYGGGYFRPQ